MTAPDSRVSLRELLAYGSCTVLAFAVDVGLLTLLVDHIGMHYAVAATLSFLVGGVLLYLLSIRFVFRYRRLENRSAEFSLFIALGIVGVLVQLLVMTVAVEKLKLHYLAAKLCSAAVTFVINFVLRRVLLFTRRAAAQE